MATKQTKRPNTRNKKTMQARAAAETISAARDFLELKSPEAQALYTTYLACVTAGVSREDALASLAHTLEHDLHAAPEVVTSMATTAYERFTSGAFQ